MDNICMFIWKKNFVVKWKIEGVSYLYGKEKVGMEGN